MLQILKHDWVTPGVSRIAAVGAAPIST